MKKYVLAMMVVGLSSAFSVFAQEADSSRPPMDPAVKAAFKECAQQATKDANGRPNRMEMDKCLEAKGITPPMHKHHKHPKPSASDPAPV